MMRVVTAWMVAGSMAACALGQTPPPPPPPAPATPPPSAPAPAAPRSPVLNPSPGGMGSQLKPRPVATLFNPNVNLKEAIDAAVARGALDRRRVIVFWGDNASRWALRLEEMVKDPEIDRQLRFHYEPIFADIGNQSFGALNVAMARTLGAEITTPPPSNMMPYITVIETVGDKKGKAILNRSSAGLENPRRPKTDGEYLAFKIQDFLREQRLPGLDAIAELGAARERAKGRHVQVFVFFLDLDDPWCLRFSSWLKRPEVAGAATGALASRFEVLTYDLSRWQGITGEFERLGGMQADAAPWYIVLDPADEKQLAPDKSKGEKDLGFPTGDEVARFIAMLRRVQPALTEAEGKVIADSLADAIKPPTAKKD